MVNVYVVEQDSPASRLVWWCLLEDGFRLATVDSPAELAHILKEDRHGVVVYNVQMSVEEKSEQIAGLKSIVEDAKVVDIEPPTSGDVPQADVTLRMPFHADDLSLAIRMLAAQGMAA